MLELALADLQRKARHRVGAAIAPVYLFKLASDSAWGFVAFAQHVEFLLKDKFDYRWAPKLVFDGWVRSSLLSLLRLWHMSHLPPHTCFFVLNGSSITGGRQS